MDEQENKSYFDGKAWKKLFPLLKDYKKYFYFLLFFNALTALVDVLLPLLQQYAVSHFIGGMTLSGLGLYGTFYFAAVLFQCFSVIGFSRCSMKVEMNFGRDVRQKLFAHLQTLSLSYYNTTPVGQILSRVMSDTFRIASIIAWNMADLLWGGFYVVGTFLSMLILNWKLALIVIVLVPALALLTVYFENKILRRNREVRKINSQITAAFNEGITGAKTSKTLVIENSNDRSFMTLTDEMHHAGLRVAKLNAVYIPLMLFISTIAVAAVMLRGGYMVSSKVLDIAILSTFLTYSMTIFEPVQQCAATIAEIISVQACIERVTGLMEEEPLVKDSPEVEAKYGTVFQPKKENWEPLIGEIEFRDVTFRYPDGGENVLEHFSLKIPAGTNVAIVGETGAGKSTLVNLACRFFEPTEGQILIDGVDYRQRSQLWLHSGIGYVLQNPHLFSGTIEDNIRYGRLDATEEEIHAAAKAVSADMVVAKLEKGWKSDVGEGGDKLSTGEKQLISFARAVLADPRIFVLDEATSSIDTQTEQLIQNAIDHLLRGRTAFLIAHRLSTIRKADLILVVKDGKIVEQGKHLELLQKHGYYHDLYSRQFAEESEARVLKAE